MARIETSDIMDPKLLKPLRDEIELTEQSLTGFSAEFTKIIELQAQAGKQTQQNAKGYAELAKAEKASKKALTEKEKVDRKILKLQQESTKVSKIQRDREQAYRVEIQRRNKVAKQSALLTNQNVGAFQKLNIRIKQLSDQYRNLLVAEGKETKQTRRLKKEILELNKIRNRANENLGMHQNRVGQYGRAIGKLRSGLAQLGLAFGVFQILRNTLGIITSFDTAMTDLAAISGKSAEEIEPLKQQALELGATTQNTAAEIGQLQLELAKLGFTTEEIMASTGGIQKFATATGADIPSAASLAGASLRAFGLDASDMDRVVSVLAVATTKSALSFDFLNTAMSTIAPVANAFGFSIEDTTALLGQLANSGFDASSAATATRNILLNLADANGDLAKALGHPVTSADDLAGALQELQAKGIDLNEALQLTDKRSVAAFQTFLNGSDSLVELRDSITDVTGELDEMSAKKLDSISGATDLLKSAWEGLILEWNEGQGIGEGIKNTLLFLAKNLKTIITIVFRVIEIWGAYRVAIKLAQLRTDFLTKSMKLNAEQSTKLSNKLKKNFALIGIAIMAVIILARELFDWFTSISNANERFGVTMDKVNENLDIEKAKLKELGKELLRAKDNTEARQKVLDKINAQYGTTLENMEDEAEFAKQIADAYTDIVQNLQKKISIQVFEEELVGANKELLRLNRQLKQAEGNSVLTFGLQEAKFELESYISLLEGKLVKLQTDLGKASSADIPCEPGFEKDANGKCVPIGGAGGDGKEIDAEKAKLDRLNALKKKHNEELLQMENELIAAGVDREIIDQMLFERRVQQLREQGDFIIELDFKDTEILKKHRNDYLHFVEKGEIERVNLHKEANHEIEDDDLKSFQLREQNHQKHLDIMEQREREAWNKIRGMIGETAKLVDQFYQGNLKNLEMQASKQEMIFNESKEREEQLRQIAKEKGLNATESIKAEREAQKKALAAQEEIERKKQRIEATLAVLRALAAKIEQGDGNPVTNIQNDVLKLKSFAEGLFHDGTPYTVQDALGYVPGRDTHLVGVDNKESIFTGKQTSELGIGKGKNSTQDVVDELLAYRSGALTKSVKLSLESSSVSDSINKVDTGYIISKKLDQLIENTVPKKQPQKDTIYDVARGILQEIEKGPGYKRRRSYHIRRKK